MADKMLNAFDVWIAAQGVKSRTRLRSVDNVSLEGVAKLRELILEFAVLGKLVPQDSKDETAEVLLKKIQDEKNRLISGGDIKKTQTIENLALESPPLLPKGWRWEALGNITSVITDGTHHTPKYIDRGIPFISVKDIDGKTISFDDCKYISSEEHELINKRCNPERGDILLCRIGTLGRATVVDTDRAFSLFVSVGLIKFFPAHILPRYLHLILHSPALTRQYEKIKAGGSHTNKLNLGDIPSLAIPIAPLLEQHRIVAKVDELMTLCDELEQQETNHLKSHQLLVQTLLGTLTQAKDAIDFQHAWNKLYEHFDDLFTTEDSIDQLKQTILQLAVMGKLVPQDPNDEPASVLLKKIAKEKVRLEEEEGLKTSAEEIISQDEKYLQTPPSWGYCRLGNIFKFIDYRGRTPEKVESGVRLITAKNVRPGYVSLEPEEFIRENDYDEWMTRGIPKVNDLLFTTEAPLGNVAMVNINERFALAQRIICLQPHVQGIAAFIKIFMLSDSFQKVLIEKATGMTATGIKASKLKEVPIPIPPIAEQKRIVEKLEELFALCDRLKERITEAQQVANQMAEGLVSQFY